MYVTVLFISLENIFYLSWAVITRLLLFFLTELPQSNFVIKINKKNNHNIVCLE
jgi:hypothetical protein